jgi:subtilisin family serine protease
MNRVALGLACALLTTFVASAASPFSFQNLSVPLPGDKKPLVVAHKHKPGELLVKFRSDIGPAAISGIASQVNATRVRPFRTKRGAKSAISRWRHLTLPAGVDVNDAMRLLRKLPGVEAVEPNSVISIAAIPDDPDFSRQWGLRNTGQEGGVPGADISATSAWDITTGDPSVVIAVIDTGVDANHPDLAPNIWTNPGEIPGNGIDDDGNGYVDDINGYDFVDNDPVPDDQNGHGTHVAGISAAAGNNGVGVTGVAWNSKIMALKIFGASGSGSVAVSVDAILYAIDNGAKILNNSWGGYGYSQALRDAVDAANDANALFVAGAGNDDNDNDVTPFYPASFDIPNVVSVAATSRVDARSDFSNYGKATVDIGAPGTFIYSTRPGGLYKLSSGTSMATPHVSGAAALLLSQTPELTAVGLKSLLLERSDSLASMHDVTTTGGRLNARASLDCNSSVILFGVRAPADDFVVLEADPTLIRAQVSSCGHPVTGYSMSATFSNGDGNLQLFDDGQHGDGNADDGIFSNYWMPQGLGPVSVTITATGSSPQTVVRQGQVRQRVRYQHASVPYAWVDATSGTSHTLANDGTATLPIGFDFDFYGITHNTITINANGLLTFGSSLPAAVNSRLPNPNLPNNLIAPFWDDYNPELGGAIYSLLQGSEPNRRLTVTWIDMRRVGSLGTASFQATLFEASNDIVFQYQDVQFEDTRYDRGAGAVVGVEDPDGLDATAYSAYQRLLNNNTARRFYVSTAEPDLTYRVTVTTTPIVGRSGDLVMSVVDGDGTNNNYFSILQFGTDGDVIQSAALTGDASGSLIPGPAHIGDANFVNEISQPKVYGNTASFLMKVSRNGTFQPFPDAFAFYLLDSSDQPFPTSDPFGTDALFAIEIDRTQPFAQIFESAYASVTVETVGAPFANPGGPYTGVVNVPLAFDGSASFDPEGQPLNFDWNFGDGATGISASPTHTYTATGSYTVTLVVDDVALYSAPETTTATIGVSQPPIANAGPDQTVDQQVPVTLDGSASTDPDGTIVSYSWRQTAGPAVTLAGANTATATFTSPLVSAQTTLTFELTVRDNTGDTGKDSVKVIVRKNNIPPTANAGPDQTVDEDDFVTLDGTGSSDLDGSVTSISWVQVQNGAPIAPLSAGSPPGVVHFTAPGVSSTTVLTFEVTVTDNGGATASDTVNVTVRNTKENIPPTANAGPDQAVDEGILVTLDGTGSSDSDGSLTSIGWVQVQNGAPFVQLSAGSPPGVVHFTAPEVAKDVALIFQVTVTDNEGATASDTVSVTVRNINDPQANAGPDQVVDEKTVVILNGSTSSDPDGTIVGYSWAQLSGIVVALSGANTATPSFTAPSVGTDEVLVFRLTVTDNDGRTGFDDVIVTVRNVNQLPVANAGPDQSVNAGANVTLSGSGSDPDGTIASYQWQQTAGPTVTLSGASTATASFTAPSVTVDTVLTFQLTITDNSGASASDSVNVTVLRFNQPPAANAGPDQAVDERTLVTLDGSGSNDPDGTGLTYQWTQIVGPTATLNDATAVNPTFTAPSVANDTTLRFTLRVTDQEGKFATDTVDILVRNTDQSPVADAGSDQTVLEGATVQLSGSGTDVDGTVVGYSWTQVSGPGVTINNNNSQTAGFVAPSVASSTTLVFRLTVTDDTGLTGSDTVNVTVLDSETDNDADGLPDGWEIQYFGDTTSQNGNGDPDGDGLTNLEEYQSGSNPTVADGIPPAVAQVSTRAGDTDAVITFGTSPATTNYDLYWSTSSPVTKTNGTKIGNVTSPYLHSGLSNGTTYYYTVVASNLHGESAESAEVSTKPGPRAWGTPVTAVNLAGFSEQIVGDEFGNGMIVYYRERVGNGPLDIYAVRYTPSGGWGSPVLIASTPFWQNSFYTSLKAAMNRRGDAVVTWMQDDGFRNNLWSSYLPAGASTWETPQLVENASGTVSPTPDISIGDDGLMVAIWMQSDGGSGDSTYASIRRPATTWSPRFKLDPAGTGFTHYVSVSADGAGGALAAWGRTSGTVDVVYGARYEGAAWQAPAVLISDNSESQSATRVRTDAAGNGLVVFARTDSRGRWDVKASKFRIGTGWDSAPTVLDGSNSEVKGPMISMRKDGRAVVAWGQGTSMYANLMSAAGTWSGAQALSKANGGPRGLVMDSLGRGLVIWSVVENSVENIYSSIVSSAGWTGKLIVEDATQSAFPGGLIADEYGNATVKYFHNSVGNKVNTFAVGNPGLGGGGGSGGGKGGGGGGGGPKPRSSTTSTDGSDNSEGAEAAADENETDEQDAPPDEETTNDALQDMLGGIQRLLGDVAPGSAPKIPLIPDEQPKNEESPTEGPADNDGVDSKNAVPRLTMVTAGIQATPSSGTDCELPSSDIVDMWGVPKDEWIRAAFIFPIKWEGSTQTFEVKTKNPDQVITSSREGGLNETVTLTIGKGADPSISTPFYIKGISVSKADLSVSAVTDDRGTGDSTDDIKYPAHEPDVVVWDLEEKDIVDYNALGGSATCQQSNETSPALKADPLDRITCGAKAEAVAADGVSYQLFRLRAGSYGKACFTVLKEDPLPQGATETQYYGRFSDPIRGKPGEFSATNMPTAFQATKPGTSASYYWALGAYTPPTDFFTATKERTVKVEVQFVPQDENGQLLRSNVTAKKEIEITIRRPPVLLVHGLWSDHCTWLDEEKQPTAFIKRPESEEGWRRIDSKFSYDQPRSVDCNRKPDATDRLKTTTSFARNLNFESLRVRIHNLIGAAQKKGLATTRVDIVAHSMGGLLSKRWMNEAGNQEPEANYRNWRNFQKGDTHKLITLHTPHLGSQIANLFIHLHNHFGHDDFSVGKLEKELLGDVHNGAICALAENSTDLAVSMSEVPDAAGYAFVGTAGRIGGLHPPLSGASILFPLSFDDHVAPFIFRIPNDAIVAADSQQGGLPHVTNPALLHSPPFKNGGFVTSDSATADQVYQMLDLREPFSASIPGSNSSGNGVPRPGVGEGPAINAAADYEVQCAAGGPMRQR